MVPQLLRLDAELRKLCPIDGVNSDGVIAFAANATLEQRLAAQALVNGWTGAPPTKDERIAAILLSKSLPMTRSEVWNAVIAANALAYGQAPFTGRTPTEQLAYNRARNKYQRECEEMEAAIRVIELEP